MTVGDYTEFLNSCSKIVGLAVTSLGPEGSQRINNGCRIRQ